MLSPLPINTTNSWDTPEINFSISADDKEVQALTGQTQNEFGLMVGGTIQAYFSRVVEVNLEITNIKVSLLSNALDRVLAAIQNAIISDMNPYTGNLPQLPANTDPIDKPILVVESSTDSTKTTRTASVKIAIKNLKSDSITATFNRVKTYTLASISTDLNP